jgi:hypothetical protein
MARIVARTILTEVGINLLGKAQQITVDWATG